MLAAGLHCGLVQGMDSAAVMTMLQDVANEVIVPRFQSLNSADVMEKNPGDLVTVADQEAEVLITKELKAAFPGCVVVGEEATAANPDLPLAVGEAEHLFVVDPVDGTKNFVNGKAEFGVMVAELRHLEPTRCWIWQPIRQQRWYAEKGAGITCNGTLLAPTQTEDTHLVGASGNPDDAGEYPEATVNPAQWACAVDYPMLAAGEVDFLVYRSLNAWDHVPGLVMINEIGGQARLIDGSPYTGRKLSAPGFIATRDPESFDRLQPLVQRLVARSATSTGPNSAAN